MRIASSIALGLTCALAVAGPAQAQPQPQPKKFVQVLTVHAKPEGAADYEAFVKKVMAAADKIGQTQRVLTFQVTTGGPGYTYMIVNYFDTWAETDGLLSTSEILAKALGEVEGARALRAGRANIESTESAVYRLLPELSTRLKAYDPPPDYLQVTRTWVKPEMTREWEGWVGRFKAAAEQMPGTPTATRRVSVEGPSNVYLTSSPYSKGAERDAWPGLLDVLTKAYGEEEARKLDAARRSSIKHSEAYILRFRPDLSRMGK